MLGKKASLKCIHIYVKVDKVKKNTEVCGNEVLLHMKPVVDVYLETISLQT